MTNGITRQSIIKALWALKSGTKPVSDTLIEQWGAEFGRYDGKMAITQGRLL